jgi:acetoin utilization deacetylase AcuC-like enzyme
MSEAERVPTGFFLHPAAALHDPGWGHPDHQGRLRALASSVGSDLLALHGKVQQVEARPARVDTILKVHSRDLVTSLREACEKAGSGQVELAPETFVSGASWDAILGSSGSVLEAVERVSAGALRNAFVAARPPGHHASHARALGFCIVNHVAVAARHLIQTKRAERVAIVDWDIHHGNGTQEIFYTDPHVFYLSLHQSPLFPGTGSAAERGKGGGEGTTLNVPLPAGTGSEVYIDHFRGAVDQAASAFDPDFILISAGYDGLAEDPLGGFHLRPADFHVLGRIVMDWAEQSCGGRVVASLEGGYDPSATGRAVVATIRALAGLSFP